MDSAFHETTLQFLLRRLNQPSPWRVSGAELADFAKRDVRQVLEAGLLKQHGDLSEYGPCSCGAGDCTRHIHRFINKTWAVCPQGLVPPENIPDEAAHLYEIDVGQLCCQLRQANQLQGEEITALGKNIYFLGRREFGPESVAFVLACRLTPRSLSTGHAVLRRGVPHGRLICLTPTRPPLDLKDVRSLSDDHVFLCPINENQHRPETPALREDDLTRLIAQPVESARTFTLYLDTRRHVVSFKGVSITMNRLAFDLLVMLAREAAGPSGWVKRETIFNAFWMTGSGNPTAEDSRIDDLAREVRNDLAKFPGVGEDKAKKLIQTKSRVGYRLTLPASEIKVI